MKHAQPLCSLEACSSLLTYLRKFEEESFLIYGHLLVDKQKGSLEGKWWVDSWPEPRVVVCFRRGARNSLVIFSRDSQVAKDLLSSIELVPGFLFFAVPDHIVPSIEELAANQSVSLKYETCYMYILKNRKVISTLENDESEGFVLDRLTREDAFVVNEHWAYADRSGNTTLYYIQYLIENFPTACIRSTSADTTSPIGWVLYNDYGAIGMLYVLEKFRGKGFAKRMVQKLTKDILQWHNNNPKERNYPSPFCYIVTTNKSSQRVFEACHYERTGIVHWISVQNKS